MKKVLIGALLAMATNASSAAALVYDCDVKANARGNAIPPRLVISFNEGDDRAIVMDGYIMDINKAPLAAALEVRSKTSYKISWELKNFPLRNSRTGGLVRFSVVLHTDRRTVSVSTILAGYDNGVMRGRGTCKVLKDN